MAKRKLMREERDPSSCKKNRLSTPQITSLTITPVRTSQPLSQIESNIMSVIENFPAHETIENRDIIAKLQELRPLYECQATRGDEHKESKQRKGSCMYPGKPTNFAMDYTKKSKGSFGALCVHGSTMTFTSMHALFYFISIVTPDGTPAFACFSLQDEVLTLARRAGFQKTGAAAIELALDAHANANALTRIKNDPQKNEVCPFSYECALDMVFQNVNDIESQEAIIGRIQAERIRCAKTVPVETLNKLETLIRARLKPLRLSLEPVLMTEMPSEGFVATPRLDSNLPGSVVESSFYRYEWESISEDLRRFYEEEGQGLFD